MYILSPHITTRYPDKTNQLFPLQSTESPRGCSLPPETLGLNFRLSFVIIHVRWSSDLPSRFSREYKNIYYRNHLYKWKTGNVCPPPTIATAAQCRNAQGRFVPPRRVRLAVRCINQQLSTRGRTILRTWINSSCTAMGFGELETPRACWRKAVVLTWPGKAATLAAGNGTLLSAFPTKSDLGATAASTPLPKLHASKPN